MKKKKIRGKKNKKLKLIGTNFLCGCLLISTGIILELKATISNVLLSNNINLNISEINTAYEEEKPENSNNSSNNQGTDIAYHVDTSWAWPASSSYYISSSYRKGHGAIDIVPRNGDYNIRAASSGVIVTSSWKWDNGNYYILKQDNGYYTMYAHLSQKSVSQGQRVEKGQVIGVMGKTGLATGVHLHFSVWNGYPYQGSSTINPLNFY